MLLLCGLTDDLEEEKTQSNPGLAGEWSHDPGHLLPSMADPSAPRQNQHGW